MFYKYLFQVTCIETCIHKKQSVIKNTFSFSSCGSVFKICTLEAAVSHPEYVLEISLSKSPVSKHAYVHQKPYFTTNTCVRSVSPPVAVFKIFTPEAVFAGCTSVHVLEISLSRSPVSEDTYKAISINFYLCQNHYMTLHHCLQQNATLPFFLVVGS